MANHGKSLVTLRDVATTAGVSISTVSRALSKPGRVNPATAARVRQVADALGYHIDAVNASAQPEQLNGLIALSVADLGNPVFGELARSVQRRCMAAHFSLTVIDSEEHTDVERAALALTRGHVDGVILASPRITDVAIRKLAAGKPTLTINRQVRGVPSVVADIHDGLREALDLLASLGHRAVTYLSGPEASWQNGTRWRMLSAMCEQRGLKLRGVPCPSPNFSGGYRCREAFLEHPTSAVIAYNDIIAIGFINALQARDIDVPRTVSVIGIDDVSFGSLVSPALTTIHIERRALGEAAADRLIRMIRRLPAPSLPDEQTIGTRLVRRASTAQVPLRVE